MIASKSTSVIVAVTDDDQNASDNIRAIAVAEFLSRRDDCPIVRVGTIQTATLLLRLAKSGNLMLRSHPDGHFVVGYIASVSTAKEILAAKLAAWPSAFISRLGREVRSTQGALFYFPDEIGEGRLEVFITDWSPCPAACAVAVHPQHPYAVGFADQEHDAFTGRFVRHPLTGDLLPVWVANWVKPNFGTGAVLVNPA